MRPAMSGSHGTAWVFVAVALALTSAATADAPGVATWAPAAPSAAPMVPPAALFDGVSADWWCTYHGGAEPCPRKAWARAVESVSLAPGPESLLDAGVPQTALADVTAECRRLAAHLFAGGVLDGATWEFRRRPPEHGAGLGEPVALTRISGDLTVDGRGLGRIEAVVRREREYVLVIARADAPGVEGLEEYGPAALLNLPTSTRDTVLARREDSGGGRLCLRSLHREVALCRPDGTAAWPYALASWSNGEWWLLSIPLPRVSSMAPAHGWPGRPDFLTDPTNPRNAGIELTALAAEERERYPLGRLPSDRVDGVHRVLLEKIAAPVAGATMLVPMLARVSGGNLAPIPDEIACLLGVEEDRPSSYRATFRDDPVLGTGEAGALAWRRSDNPPSSGVLQWTVSDKAITLTVVPPRFEALYAGAVGPPDLSRSCGYPVTNYLARILGDEGVRMSHLPVTITPVEGGPWLEIRSATRDGSRLLSPRFAGMEWRVYLDPALVHIVIAPPPAEEPDNRPATVADLVGPKADQGPEPEPPPL